MDLDHLKTIIPQSPISDTVCGLSSSSYLGICINDRIVRIYDKNFELKDKFSLKMFSRETEKVYISCISFSNDCKKLAVGQSDNYVIVYKFGDDKKTICNKIQMEVSVSVLKWFYEKTILVGLEDGTLKLVFIGKNESAVVYKSDSYITNISIDYNQRYFLTSHTDGKVNIFSWNIDKKIELLRTIPLSEPFCSITSWARENLLSVSQESKLCIFDLTGKIVQDLDDESIRENSDYLSADVRENKIVIGGYNIIRIILWNEERQLWDDSVREFKNLYQVSHITFGPNNSNQIIAGTQWGNVEVFEVSLKASKHKENFQIQYINLSKVLLTNIWTRENFEINSKNNHVIKEIYFLKDDKFIIIYTTESLIVLEIATKLQCEVDSKSFLKNENFYFPQEFPKIVVIFKKAEIILVKLSSGMIWSTNSSKSNINTFSLRYHEDEKKLKVAYTSDPCNIVVQDITNKQIIRMISSQDKIDWLEMNDKSNMLLFHDELGNLYLRRLNCTMGQNEGNILKQSNCNFAKWVPNRDIFIAQANEMLTINYLQKDYQRQVEMNSFTIQQVTPKEIILYDTIKKKTIVHSFDEDIDMDDKIFEEMSVEDIFKKFEETSITEDSSKMWQKLGHIAIKRGNFEVAKKSFNKINDFIKVDFINKHKDDLGSEANRELFSDLLKDDFKDAKMYLMNMPDYNRAIEILKKMNKWDEAIAVARQRSGPDLESDLRKQQIDFLKKNSRHSDLAQVYRRTLEIGKAVDEHMKAGEAVKAADLIISHPKESQSYFPKVKTIIDSLTNLGQFEKAANLWSLIGEVDEAFSLYIKSKCFKKAIKLAKGNQQISRDKVLSAHNAFAKALLASDKTCEAIEQFINAEKLEKALEVSLTRKELSFAKRILEKMENEPRFKLEAITGYKKLLDLTIDNPDEHTEITRRINEFHLRLENNDNQAYKQSRIENGMRLLADQKYDEAEEIFAEINEIDKFIDHFRLNDMIKNKKMLIGLYAKYRPDDMITFKRTLIERYLAKGDNKSAVKYMIEIKENERAIALLIESGDFERAYSVALKGNDGDDLGLLPKMFIKWFKLHGPTDSVIKVTMNSIEIFDSIVEELLHHTITPDDDNDGDDDIERVAEIILSIAKRISYGRTKEIYSYLGRILEAKKDYNGAREVYTKSKDFKALIDLFVTLGEWEKAIKLAKKYDKATYRITSIKYGKELLTQPEQVRRGEMILLKFDCQEYLFNYYLNDAKSLDDAMRIAKSYFPDKIESLTRDNNNLNVNNSGSANQIIESDKMPKKIGSDNKIRQFLNRANELEKEQDFDNAMESYKEFILNYLEPESNEMVANICFRLLDIARLHAKDEDQKRVYYGVIESSLKSIKSSNYILKFYMKQERYDDAIKLLISQERFDLALKIARKYSTSSLVEKIQEKEKEWNMNHGKD